MSENHKSLEVTVETNINAPIETVWECWTQPQHIMKWAFASDDWEVPAADNDLRIGGRFKTIMAAKDGSARFDFEGIYTNVKNMEVLEYDIEDGRHVKINFFPLNGAVRVMETFEMENTHSKEMQRSGWQAILDNFKKYTEIQQ